MFAAALVPAAGGGLVLCVDVGPDAHVALETASCCADAAGGAALGGASAPALAPRSLCTSCVDMALPGTDAGKVVRIQTAAAAIPAQAPCAVLAVPRASEAPRLTAPAPQPRASSSLPLALRI